MAKITIDGKEFDTETFSDEAKQNLRQLRVCDQKIRQLRHEIAIAQTARNVYAQALKSKVTN